MSTALNIYQGAFGRVALLDMDRPLVPHAHHHCHILLKASGADTQFTVNGRHCPLSDTEAVLVNAWEPHSYSHIANAPQTLILALYIEPAWLADCDRQLGVCGHPRFFPSPVAPVGAKARALIARMTEAMLHCTYLGQDTVEGMIFDLVMAVIEDAMAWRVFSQRKDLGRHVVDFRVRRAVGYMREHLADPLDIQTLSKVAGLSRPHFFTLFKKTTSLTPGVYHNMLRMEAAITRIAGSSDGLSEIAVDLGFDAPGNFTRFFRQHQGATPSGYRRAVELFGAAG